MELVTKLLWIDAFLPVLISAAPQLCQAAVCLSGCNDSVAAQLLGLGMHNMNLKRSIVLNQSAHHHDFVFAGFLQATLTRGKLPFIAILTMTNDSTASKLQLQTKPQDSPPSLFLMWVDATKATLISASPEVQLESLQLLQLVLNEAEKENCKFIHSEAVKHGVLEFVIESLRSNHKGTGKLH